MGLAAGDDMFYIGFAGVGEISAAVRTVDAASLLGYNLELDTLGIGVII